MEFVSSRKLTSACMKQIHNAPIYNNILIRYFLSALLGKTFKALCVIIQIALSICCTVCDGVLT